MSEPPEKSRQLVFEDSAEILIPGGSGFIQIKKNFAVGLKTERRKIHSCPWQFI